MPYILVNVKCLSQKHNLFLSILSLGTLTPVYGKDMEDNWAEAGTFKLEADGSYIFTPKDGYIGYVPFDYVAEDEYGGTDDAELFIKVIPMYDYSENNPPIAQNDTYIMEQTQTAHIPVLSNDSDSDQDDILSLQEAHAKGPGNGQITLGSTPQNVYDESGATIIGQASVDNEDRIVFTSAADFTGEVPFDYVLSDGNGGTNTAQLSLDVRVSNTINNVYTNDDAVIGKKGESITGTIRVNDKIEGVQNTLTVNNITIDVNNTNIPTPTTTGILTFNMDGTYTFIPHPNFAGTIDVVYQICNTNGECDKTTLYLTTLKESIKAKDDAVQTPKGKPVTANVLTNDKGTGIKVTKINGENVPGTGSKTIVVTGGSLTIYQEGTYTFTPEADFTDKVPTISYVVKDKSNKEDIAELDITVIPDIVENQNDAPIAINDIFVTEQSKTVEFKILSNDHDPDKDSITIIKIKLDTNGDGNLETVPVPAGSSITKNVYDGTTLTGKITIHSDGTTTFVPENNFVGQIPDIEYTIQEGSANHEEDTAKIKITVMPDKTNSVFANDDYGVARNAAETIEIEALKNDFDPEGDEIELISIQVYTASNTLETLSLTASWSKDVYNGNIKIGTLSFEPNSKKLMFQGEADFKGTVALPYTIKDSKGATSSATIYLTQLATGNTPLPIELVSFNARLQGNSVELTWVSATEINNDFYSIYKSNNGKIWKFWKDVKGAGNSSVELTYTETDNALYQGENYYKLSQTDFDGTTEELGVRVVQINADANLTAYPNPTEGLITIDGAYNNLNSLRIVSVLGAVVTGNVNIISALPHQLQLDLSNLRSGTYFIHLDNVIIQVVKN